MTLPVRGVRQKRQLSAFTPEAVRRGGAAEPRSAPAQLLREESMQSGQLAQNLVQLRLPLERDLFLRTLLHHLAGVL